MPSLTKMQFIEALWVSYREARFEGLEWKWVEWVRDPTVRMLGIKKTEFNRLLEQVMVDSYYDRIPWVIQVDTDTTPNRHDTIKRMTPVVIQGVRVYVIRMAQNPDSKATNIPDWEPEDPGDGTLPPVDAHRKEESSVIPLG